MEILAEVALKQKTLRKKTIKYPNGDVYIGEVNNGNKRHGKGKMTYKRAGMVYEGEWKNGLYYGKGKKTYGNGDWYKGGWKDGYQHGQGKYTYAHGSVYEGEFKNRARHGQGKMIYKNGDVYKGNWNCNKEHGQGTLHKKNGFIFTGITRDKKLIGKFFYPNRCIFIGVIEKGKHFSTREGPGQMIYPEKDWYSGEWKDRKKHGWGKYKDCKGDIYEGEWREDQKEGWFKVTRKNGNISTEKFIAGKQFSVKGYFIKRPLINQ